MKTWAALLRGINVGGRNSLPMAELRELVGQIGGRAVQSYVQSGNLVFEADRHDRRELAVRLAAAVEVAKGFRPLVIVLSQDDLGRAVAENPFPEGIDEPKALHLFFLLDAPADPDLEALEKLRNGSERYELKESVFYLWCPDGFGPSKLAAGAERALGVKATSRNWRTVEKLRDLAAESAGAP